jgi:N-acetylneuraminate synthase
MTEYFLELALPSEAIAREIFQWRIDSPEACLHLEKDFDAFFQQFQRDYFQISEPSLFFLRDASMRLAYIRFRPERGESSFVQCREISVAVHPTMRGQGLGRQAICFATQVAKQYGIHKLRAYIHPENEISKKAFLRSGYKYTGRFVSHTQRISGENTVALDVYEMSVLPVPKPKNVFLIAEIGSNWKVGGENENKQMAEKLVKAAAAAGVNAVKFQTFRAKSVYASSAGRSQYLANQGVDHDIHELFHQLEMAYEDIPFLADLARRYNLEFMSTPFSEPDFDAVDSFVNRHKIASYEIAYQPLLVRAAASKKPVLLSTGASFLEEIGWSIAVLQQAGCQDITLLQCTAAYPAPSHAMNLRALITLHQAFGLPVGLSDHSQDCVTAPVLAVAYGASVIEKHITLNRSLPGPDQRFAIEPDELAMFVEKVRTAEMMVGSGIKEVLPEERELFLFAKRAVQATQAIQKNEQFELGKNIDLLRPGNNKKGSHPSQLNTIIGKHASHDIQDGEGVKPEDVV